jgi:predicted Holliday junction resolvase-like endonuclease
MEIYFVIILCFVLILALGAMTLFIFKRDKKVNQVEFLDQLQKDLSEKIAKIPDVVINKAIGHTNVGRGAFGEMISFLRLKAEYDKIIPFHDIVDFIGIHFPKEDKEESIDFIDIKTGKARLTREQNMLKSLIKEKKIGFIKISLTVNDTIPFEELTSNAIQH